MQKNPNLEVEPTHYRINALTMQAVMQLLYSIPYGQVHETIALIRRTSDGPYPGPAKQNSEPDPCSPPTKGESYDKKTPETSS